LSDVGGEVVRVASRLAHLSLILPNSLYQFAVAQLGLALAHDKLLVHLLQVFVAIGALLHEGVLLVLFASRLIRRLRLHELLDLHLLRAVQVAATREAFEQLLRCRRDLRLLTDGICVLLLSIFNNLALESPAQRVLDNRPRLGTRLILNPLELKGIFQVAQLLLLAFLRLFEISFVLPQRFLHCVLHGARGGPSRLQIRARLEKEGEASEALGPLKVRNRGIHV